MNTAKKTVGLIFTTAALVFMMSSCNHGVCPAYSKKAKKNDKVEQAQAAVKTTQDTIG